MRLRACAHVCVCVVKRVGRGAAAPAEGDARCSKRHTNCSLAFPCHPERPKAIIRPTCKQRPHADPAVNDQHAAKSQQRHCAHIHCQAACALHNALQQDGEKTQQLRWRQRTARQYTCVGFGCVLCCPPSSASSHTLCPFCPASSLPARALSACPPACPPHPSEHGQPAPPGTAHTCGSFRMPRR